MNYEADIGKEPDPLLFAEYSSNKYILDIQLS
jgi:hypothetical protein